MGSGRKSRCHWCGGSFVRIGDHYWCTSEPCRQRQLAHSVSLTNGSVTKFLYVPLPRQVEFDACTARNLLGGGAAGSTKSHAARWSLYRRALKIPNYEALILRKTWDELNKHHFRLMAREAKIFRDFGLDVNFSITNREMTWPNGSVIEGGHMENPEDVDKYLSRERDDIVCDEGSTFQPRPLLELSTRARSSKPEVIEDGDARFRVFTNPGGPAANMLRDFFIDHEPNWEDFPPQLREEYDPAEWAYIPGNLEDNPYLPERYERDLAILAPWRYQQLRFNDWDVVAGVFFTEFATHTHVADLGDPGDNVEWFRSLDWGYVSPGVCLWWACMADGVYYIRKEFKFSHATIPVVCDKINEMTDELGVYRVRYTAADPSLWSPAGNGGEDMNETFMRAGTPLIKAKNDRVNGWQRVREMLQMRPDNRPTLIIHPDCRYLIRTLSGAISSKSNPEDVDTNIDDHAIDALRYGAMSRPAPTHTKAPAKAQTFKAWQQKTIDYRRSINVR